MNRDRDREDHGIAKVPIQELYKITCNSEFIRGPAPVVSWTGRVQVQVQVQLQLQLQLHEKALNGRRVVTIWQIQQ